MIQIIYHRGENKLTVRGHAESAAFGRDLVCASVSVLVNTLAAFARNCRRAGQVQKPTIRLESGDTLILCRAKPAAVAGVTLVMDSICGGFELLAHDYPDYVTYRVYEP